MREAGEDKLPITSHEISKKNGSIIPRIKRIRIGKCVRDDVNLMPIEAPGAPAPKCKFELRQRAHDNRIHILGVKPRILQTSLVVKPSRLHGAASALFERERIFILPVQRAPIDHWFVKRVRRRVVVDDVDTVPARAGHKFLRGHRQLCS